MFKILIIADFLQFLKRQWQLDQIFELNVFHSRFKQYIYELIKDILRIRRYSNRTRRRSNRLKVRLIPIAFCFVLAVLAFVQ